VVKSFPAVWVVFKGEAAPEDIGDGAFRHQPTFSILVGQQNRRNEKASRRGADGKVGSYQMIEDIRGLLAGQSLALDIETFQPGAVRALVNNKTASIYALEVSTRYVSEAAFDTVADTFAALHVDWDVPPLGNVTGPLPVTDPLNPADAEDLIKPEIV